MMRLAADMKNARGDASWGRACVAGALLLGVSLPLAMASPQGAAREPQGRIWCQAQGMKPSRIHGVFAFCTDGQNRMFVPPKN